MLCALSKSGPSQAEDLEVRQPLSPQPAGPRANDLLQQSLISGCYSFLWLPPGVCFAFGLHVLGGATLGAVGMHLPGLQGTPKAYSPPPA